MAMAASRQKTCLVELFNPDSPDPMKALPPFEGRAKPASLMRPAAESYIAQ
jgi:hypothetical protein